MRVIRLPHPFLNLPTPVPDGLEDTWVRRQDEQGIYRFDAAEAADVYSIGRPPPTVSGLL